MEQTEEAKFTEEKIKLLMKVSRLAVPNKLPTDYSKHCLDIWAAFELGEAYQKLMHSREET